MWSAGECPNGYPNPIVDIASEQHHRKGRRVKLDEVVEQLRAAGVFSIVAKEAPGSNDRHRFAGTFTQYIEALKAVRASFAYVYAQVFDAEDLTHESSSSESDAEDVTEESERVNLSIRHPELNQYRKYFGQHGMYWLSVPLGQDHLHLIIEESWFETFHEVKSQAVEALETEAQGRREEREAQEDAKVEALLRKLRALEGDSKFAKLKTLRAMQQYAVQQLPELEELDPAEVKREIQTLKDTLDIRAV